MHPAQRHSGAAEPLSPPGVRVAPAAAGAAGRGARNSTDPALLGAFLQHPIVVDNPYTRWFRNGDASREELRHFTVQFSVFSNQFLVAQLSKLIQAETLDSMRASKEILANELGVVFHGGTVDGGVFRFRAAHFESLLQFAAGLGLEFGDLGKARQATASTRHFCDELRRLYGSEDWCVAAGASVAIENWAAAGFWQELVDGLVRIRSTRLPDLALGFFLYHNRIESQHADHTRAELADLQRNPGFDATVFVHSGCRMLDALAAFWYGLDGDRGAFPRPTRA
jgi:pyrroloquinoline quinone (PQQ) biosynthesis protein C